ncbi:putative sulfatase [Candidatus Moduliflexus flocculans]|uniref:Putative sulfatase n=1 Tax=Candidatus Moduliflexus flocculans TaxID=1499966 RepID=A0A0S6VX40_9BACT|nr:putative sulfatase [Candidatus Moduliflexus flocculans]
MNTPVYYPALLALTPLFFLFAHNLSELSLLEQESFLRLGAPSAIILLCSWGMFRLSQRIFGTAQKAGIFTAMLWAFIFGYGYFYAILVEHYGMTVLLSMKGVHIGYNKSYLLGGLLCGLVISYWLKRTTRNLDQVTRFLNRFAIILLALFCGQIMLYEGQRIFRSPQGNSTPAFAQEFPREMVSQSLPDIYYIILDSYAANSVLRSEFNYDNHEFLAYLREQGFYVAEQSQSNYPFTVLSLASSLNFDYLDALTNLVGTPTNDLSTAMDLIEKNAVMHFLKKYGYAYIHFNTIFAPTARNRFADWEVDCARGFIKDRFLKLFVKMTVFDPIVRRFSGTKREEIECQFSALAEFSEKPGRRFVFAHLVIPHEPFVFLADGREVEKTKQETYQGNRQYAPEGRQLYIQQLRYVNRKVQTLVETILAHSQRPPIIILQADHGARIPMERTPEPKWFSILNAYYFPEGTPPELYPSISPVNTFRILLNRYFHTSYALLPDRRYYSDIYHTPYQFVEVPSE